MMRPNVFNLLVRRIVSNWRTALVAMLYSHFFLIFFFPVAMLLGCFPLLHYVYLGGCHFC